MPKSPNDSLSNVPSAERLRAAMEANAAFFLQKPGICGYGVAWREGFPAFVVKAQSLQVVGQLRHSLPESIEGLPLRIEVGEVPEYVEADSMLDVAPRHGLSIRRLLAWLTNRELWFACARKPLPRH